MPSEQLLPHWTVTYNIVSPENDKWVGTGHEFFDCEADATACYQRQVRSGNCPTKRPYYDRVDRVYLAVVHHPPTPAVATNYPAAIALLRSLREASDPVEVERQKESWVALESALSGPAVATGDGEWSITKSALLSVLERLRTKNRNLNRDWYVGWDAAIQCLIGDVTAAAVSPSGAGGDEAEYGWLLEKSAAGDIWYVTVDQLLTWTTDPLKALRLARRADAEMLCEIVEDCERIGEHQWG